MRETRNVEFKREVSNTFLKTVSAYANYGRGYIYFGLEDDGSIIGVLHPIEVCIQIENKINDNIDPIPDYSLHIDDKTSVIELRVEQGINTPYLYKSKAYKRNDSSTIEVDRLELSRLILKGQNLSFEEMTSKNQELDFDILLQNLKKELGIDEISINVLKTLELYKDTDGFNNAAALLADSNNFCGIDIMRFGSTINIILERETFEHESILKQQDDVMTVFQKNYIYEQIKGTCREKKERIPEEAFREAIANALVHRTWDVKANIHVSMFENRIEIVSPGGLPSGISKEEYIKGGISIPRNSIICNVFYRLHRIERFGTGIRRINECYKKYKIKPQFHITENQIQIILPVINENLALSKDEQVIYSYLEKSDLASSFLVKESGFGKTKVVSIVNKLMKEGYVKQIGTGRGTRYTIR